MRAEDDVTRTRALPRALFGLLRRLERLEQRSCICGSVHAVKLRIGVRGRSEGRRDRTVRNVARCRPCGPRCSAVGVLICDNTSQYGKLGQKLPAGIPVARTLGGGRQCVGRADAARRAAGQPSRGGVIEGQYGHAKSCASRTSILLPPWPSRENCQCVVRFGDLATAGPLNSRLKGGYESRDAVGLRELEARVNGHDPEGQVLESHRAEARLLHHGAKLALVGEPPNALHQILRGNV